MRHPRKDSQGSVVEREVVAAVGQDVEEFTPQLANDGIGGGAGPVDLEDGFHSMTATVCS